MEDNKSMPLEEFYKQASENGSVENQRKRIISYAAIAKANIIGNNLAGKKTLYMGNAFGYMDITSEMDYLAEVHKELATELKLNLHVSYELGDIRYKW